MAEGDKQDKEQQEGSIDYSGSQQEIDKAKAKAAQADRERLAEEQADNA